MGGGQGMPIIMPTMAHSMLIGTSTTRATVVMRMMVTSMVLHLKTIIIRRTDTHPMSR